MADFIVYDASDKKEWLVIHELSQGALDNKRSKGRIQLSATLDMLCKSKAVKTFRLCSRDMLLMPCQWQFGSAGAEDSSVARFPTRRVAARGVTDIGPLCGPA